MDTTFIKYIEEIEKLYIHLPKVQRVRVEKWVEKLVNIGSNTVWRKHRNAYTKLLLNMVVSRNLSEPFNVLPPDGPLPSYPFHIKPITKDLIGVHETTFWRDLHNRLQEQDTRENLINSSILGGRPPLSTNIDTSHLTSSKKVSYFGDNPLSREINNLQLLIQEQDQKILLLEQQLHEERVKHELTIQRMNYAHRMEIHKLLTGDKSTPSDLQANATVYSSLEKPLYENAFSTSNFRFGNKESSSPYHESPFSSSFQTQVLRGSNQRSTHPQEDLYNTNRLYQSFPSDKYSWLERKEQHSGLPPSPVKDYNPPYIDFSATLKRGHSPIIPTDSFRGNTQSNRHATEESVHSEVSESLRQNGALFDVSRSFTRDYPVTAQAVNDSATLDHSVGLTDILPTRRFSPTQGEDKTGVEPNISVISVHKEKTVSFPELEQKTEDVIPTQEKAPELLINSFEEKIQDNPELQSKDSSDEEYLNYSDQFQQHIQSF